MRLARVITPVVLAFALAACAPFPLTVVPQVSGTVIDARTGKPIAGANVYVVEYPDEGTQSSADGRFVIKAIRKWQVVVFGVGDLPPAYMLVAEAPSYRQSRRRWHIGDDREPVFSLEPSPKQ